MTWLADAYRFCWLGAGDRALVVSHSQPELGAPLAQLVSRFVAASWVPEAAIKIRVDDTGCAIEEIVASASGRWAATERFSGQGECGFDFLDVERMELVGGVTDQRGYMLGPPVFSEDESRMVTGHGPWLGGFWVHPEDDIEDPARGGVVDMGRICVHVLPSHEEHWHQLELDVPAGWLPDDVWDEKWYGPRSMTPFEQGVRMVLPGGDVFEHPDPLPHVIRLPRLSAFG